MKKLHPTIIAITLPLMALTIVWRMGLVLPVQAAPSSRPLYASCVVTNTNDSGPGSLRECMLNAGAGDTITFNPTVFPPGSPATIALTSSLPEITQGNLTIDGSGAGVILDGSACSQPCDNGFSITSNGNLIKNLQIFNFSANGIRIESGAKYNTIANNVLSGNAHWGVDIEGSGTMSNTVIGNLIGTDASGMAAMGNESAGVMVQDGAQYNIVGGDTPDERNIISGNGSGGVDIRGSDTNYNTVSGNYIGTNISGTVAISNSIGAGVAISDGAGYNTIGGDIAGERNVISGNDSHGVTIIGAHHNVVSGNYIGTDVNGMTVISNNATGIRIWNGSQYNTIGGDTVSERNLISGNDGSGVSIDGTGTMSNTVTGNLIGTDASGTAAIGNSHNGVGIGTEASYNVIGGNTPEERNVISGNNGVGVQILFNPAHNTVSGNFIGTDVSGTAALPNTSGGVQLGHGSNDNVVGGSNASPGGTCSGECNLISGNTSVGLSLGDDGTEHNIVSGNYIGTDVNGTTVISNGDIGVYIFEDASYNTIGGNTPAKRNLISGNKVDGVGIASDNSKHNKIIGNYIGPDVNGTNALGNGGDGVYIWSGAKENVVGGAIAGEDNLISGNGNCGVHINGSGTISNTIIGNLIGTDASGTVAMGNGNGVSIHDEAQYNTIGGDTPAERNIISGNTGDGVDINDSHNNTVSGNYIGTDINGATAIPNGEAGVGVCCGASCNTIGGDTASKRNIISGNNAGGVRIFGLGSSTNHNIVSGNYIGTNANGTAAIPNPVGVSIWGGAQYNIIGGMASSEQNIIAFNVGDGVQVEGSNTLRNTITRNSIHFNTEMGIDLFDGGNTEFAAPTIITYNQTAGTISGTACANCTIEIFSDDDDEGRVYEGSATADAGGNWAFNKGSVLVGPNLTATATDSQGNTSEFSAPVFGEALSRTYVYLPLVLKTPAVADIYIHSINTGGINPVEIRNPNNGNELLLSCAVGNNVTQFCGAFPAVGTYSVTAYTANCGQLGPKQFSDATPGSQITRIVLCQ